MGGFFVITSVRTLGISTFLGCLASAMLFAAEGPRQPEPAPSAATGVGDEVRQKYDEAIELINSYAGKGDNYQRAFTLLAELAKRNPASGYPYAGLAELKYQLYAINGEGSPQEIRALIGKALSLDAQSVGAYVVQAKLALRENKIMEAQNAVYRASTYAPSNPDVMFAQARVAETLGDFTAAEKWYRQAINAMPNPVRKSNMYHWLGRMFLKKDPPDIANAHVAMRSEADLASDQPWKLNNYADFLNNYTRDYDVAIDYASRALKLSDFGAARVNLGMAMYAKWADTFLNPAKAKSSSGMPDSPKTIHAKTGVSPELAFVRAATTKASTYVTAALLKAGIVQDPDTVPPGYCCTAFIGASFSGDLELARLLTEKGANVNAQDRERGGTALFNFIIDRNIKAVEFLLSKEARLNQLDSQGNTPLHLAVNVESADPKLPTTRLLLKRGADPEIPNRSGLNLLAHAVNGYPAAVRLLVKEYKGDVNMKLPDGHALLARAATAFYGERGVEIVGILIEAGANPWVTWSGTDVTQTLDSPLYQNNPGYKKITAMIQAARRTAPMPAGFPEYSSPQSVTK
jgi:tetratricopeptide (TPR) repeat protein